MRYRQLLLRSIVALASAAAIAAAGPAVAASARSGAVAPASASGESGEGAQAIVSDRRTDVPARTRTARPSADAAAPGGAAVSASSTTTTTTLPTSPTTTVEQVRDVSDGGRFHAGFLTGGEDFFVFELTTPKVVILTTSDGEDGCDGDTRMRLKDGAGVVIASDDESGPGHCSRIAISLGAGDYTIEVDGFMNSAVVDYWLDVEFYVTECGNGDVEPLEECDDGNFDDDDCCLSDCSKAADGLACDDGLLCNGDDTCDDGTCKVHTLDPCPGIDGDANCSESCSDTAPGCSNPDPDGSPCNNGLFCDGDDRCSGGICIVHAGNPCRGPDGDGICNESCKESSDTCTAADPGGTPCDDNNWCNGEDTCYGGSCSIHTGNPCTGADGDGDCRESCSERAENCKGADPNGSSCNDGLFCTGTDKCTGGLCAQHTGSGCPGADGDSNCVESCNEQAKNCSAPDPPGAACSDGLFCNGADSCDAGICSLHAGSPCPGPDGDAVCTESCNEASDACNAADANGSPCNDGIFCNGADTCQNGACTGHAGNPCPGSDGDGNCAETCNEAADDCSTPDPNGSACNDGLFCNGTDTCASGACATHAGDPCTGPDGDGNCSESCNEAGDTCTQADANGSPCNDGVFCNGSDTCSAGACSAHAGDPCTGPDGDANCAESCNEGADSCAGADTNGAPCNDGVFCNGADTCLGGACSVHSGNPCPGADGDANCSESCSEAADACTAPDPDTSACTDGLFCNGTDACSAGSCTAHSGDPCSGPDGDGNCAESCSEAADACTAADPNGSTCSDGLFCNGADSCAAGACSSHAGSPCSGPDGDASCAESCSEVFDNCLASDPEGSACNDGLFCNGADSCASGSCTTHAGNPCTGADGDVDCSESCNETFDNCTANDPDTSACDDGLACNGADSCIGGSCNQHSASICEGADGDGDCSESCSDQSGGCDGPDPNGTPCDDGIFCNGPDRCSAGSCSVHLGNPCPGADGDANCAESCNEAADSCTAPDPNGAACSDGLFCNGSDSCAAGACTTHAGSPCPGPDGDASCTESCDENSDSCSAPDANGSACNDGIFCNGADTCASGACTGHTGNPCTGPDGDGNCSESCSEANDSCNAADPDTTACNDGLYCNGADACSGGACAVHAGDPCPGADGDGNCAESCSEASDACTAADPAASACDDGIFCNGDDSCTQGLCQTHTGTPCVPNAVDDDCSQSCDEQAKSCTANDPPGSACDDAVFCNGDDHCAAGQCSGHDGDPCSGGDGDSDCAESCNEAGDACNSPDAEGSSCSDGDACSVADTCDGAGICTSGDFVSCDDHDACTVDACQEAEPHCTHTDIPGCPFGLCGDVNGNGTVTAGDALSVLKAAVGGNECAGKLCTCDPNASGTLTASDALAVLRYAVGTLTTLGCVCG